MEHVNQIVNTIFQEKSRMEIVLGQAVKALFVSET